MLQDFAWLELINESRIKGGLETISEDVFELAMDRFEKESVFQCEFSTGEGARTAAVDEDAACSVCGSGDIDNDNNILFCDLCNIAVHQVSDVYQPSITSSLTSFNKTLTYYYIFLFQDNLGRPASER